MPSRFTILVLTVSAILAPFLARGEEPEAPARPPVESFALTEKGFAKYSEALGNLEAVAEPLARAAREEEKKEKPVDASPDAVIGLIAGLCERIEVFRDAVDAAELTCREYAMIDVTLMQASVLSVGYRERGAAFLESFPGETASVVKGNLEFVIERQDAIGALVARQRRVFAGK